MATRLEAFIESIDPSRTIYQVSAATDEAFNSFKSDHPIRSFEDYQKYMSAFVQYIEQAILKFKANDPYNKEVFWSRYSDLTRALHGPDAWKLNYEKIISGKDGGLYKILKDIAAKIMNDRSGSEISARVWRFWEALTNEEKLETVNEFLGKFGYILPSEYTGGGGAYLKINFPRVLEKYPQLLIEIRRAVK